MFSLNEIFIYKSVMIKPITLYCGGEKPIFKVYLFVKYFPENVEILINKSYTNNKTYHWYLSAESLVPYLYKIVLNNIKNITPGIPKKPAISAVTAFIPMCNPKLAPTRFTRNKATAPNTPFTISFTRILSGQRKSFATIKIANIPIITYSTPSIVFSSPKFVL